MNLAYPLAQIHINQLFGANVAYYKANFGTNGHMGVDFQAPHATPVYAAHDGFAFYVGPDSHGGDGVYLRFNDGGYYTCIYWHLIAATDPTLHPTVGSPGRDVKQGDLLGYADNTGAPFESSGDHLHFGLAPCDEYGDFTQPSNGFNGCIDPLPYFNGTYALQTPTPAPVATVSVQAVQKAETGNLSLANILYSIAGLVSAWWNQ